MNCSPKIPMTPPDRVADPLAGARVGPSALPGKGDLADWVELMEAVEALCPVWPVAPAKMGGEYKL